MLKYVSALLLLIKVSTPAQAQIAFDAASSGEVINGTSVTYNHPVSGTSTLLVVGVHTLSGTEVLNTVTYNGLALTLIDKIFIQGSPRWVYQYALANAPQGSHALTVTTTSAVNLAVVSASYTGVVGLPADNFTKQWTPVGDSPIAATTTLTPNTNNTWTILVGGAVGPPIGAGSGSTMRATSGEFSAWPYANRLGIFDSDGPINPAAATSMTVTGAHPYTDFGTVMASYAAAETTAGPLPRLYSNSLEYLGAFRVPFWCGTDHLGFGGQAIAFKPSGSGVGSLYISSKTNKVAEISIPEELVDSEIVSSLEEAKCIQPFREPTEDANLQNNLNNGAYKPPSLSGMVVADGKLWINNGVYYDDAGSQRLSLVSRPLNLSTMGQVKGLYGLTSSEPGFTPSMASTQIAAISSDWIPAMGGNLFLSKFNKPIISSQSYGPNAIVAKTSWPWGDAGSTYEAPTPLFYPGTHPLSCDPGGVCDDGGGETGHVYTTFSHAHDTGSLVQPAGTSTLLVFQVAGATRGPSLGNGYGYGCGCEEPVLPNAPSCPSRPSEPCEGGNFHYDPERAGHGTHGYPYVYQIVAYDMNDLAAVIGETKEPWEPRPYAFDGSRDYWEFTFRITPPDKDSSPTGHATPHELSNATYDSASNKIYIAQLNCCDWYGQDPKPIIHVYRVNP